MAPSHIQCTKLPLLSERVMEENVAIDVLELKN